MMNGATKDSDVWTYAILIKDSCSKNMARNILIGGNPDMMVQQMFFWKGFESWKFFLTE